jgi:hypothetical protein
MTCKKKNWSVINQDCHTETCSNDLINAIFYIVELYMLWSIKVSMSFFEG